MVKTCGAHHPKPSFAFPSSKVLQVLSSRLVGIGRLHALSPGLMPTGFGADPCFMPYLSALPKAFASSNLSLSRLVGITLPFEDPVLARELHKAKDGVTTFHTVDPMVDLGAPSTTVADPAQFAGRYNGSVQAVKRPAS